MSFSKHILNFHKRKIEKLPLWMKPPFNVIMGVGDFNHNIDNFKEFDVYVILPDISDKKSCEN